MLVWLLFVALVGYNILDVYQSILLFQLGAYEINPIINYIAIYTGLIPSIVILKSFWLIVLLGLLIIKKEKGHEKM